MSSSSASSRSFRQNRDDDVSSRKGKQTHSQFLRPMRSSRIVTNRKNESNRDGEGGLAPAAKETGNDGVRLAATLKVFEMEIPKVAESKEKARRRRTRQSASMTRKRRMREMMRIRKTAGQSTIGAGTENRVPMRVAKLRVFEMPAPRTANDDVEKERSKAEGARQRRKGQLRRRLRKLSVRKRKITVVKKKIKQTSQPSVTEVPDRPSNEVEGSSKVESASRSDIVLDSDAREESIETKEDGLRPGETIATLIQRWRTEQPRSPEERRARRQKAATSRRLFWWQRTHRGSKADAVQLTSSSEKRKKKTTSDVENVEELMGPIKQGKDIVEDEFSEYATTAASTGQRDQSEIASSQTHDEDHLDEDSSQHEVQQMNEDEGHKDAAPSTPNVQQTEETSSDKTPHLVNEVIKGNSVESYEPSDDCDVSDVKSTTIEHPVSSLSDAPDNGGHDEDQPHENANDDEVDRIDEHSNASDCFENGDVEIEDDIAHILAEALADVRVNREDDMEGKDNDLIRNDEEDLFRNDVAEVLSLLSTEKPSEPKEIHHVRSSQNTGVDDDGVLSVLDIEKSSTVEESLQDNVVDDDVLSALIMEQSRSPEKTRYSDGVVIENNSNEAVVVSADTLQDTLPSAADTTTDITESQGEDIDDVLLQADAEAFAAVRKLQHQLKSVRAAFRVKIDEDDNEEDDFPSPHSPLMVFSDRSTTRSLEDFQKWFESSRLDVETQHHHEKVAEDVSTAHGENSETTIEAPSTLLTPISLADEVSPCSIPTVVRKISHRANHATKLLVDVPDMRCARIPHAVSSLSRDHRSRRRANKDQTEDVMSEEDDRLLAEFAALSDEDDDDSMSYSSESVVSDEGTEDEILSWSWKKPPLSPVKTPGDHGNVASKESNEEGSQDRRHTNVPLSISHRERVHDERVAAAREKLDRAIADQKHFAAAFDGIRKSHESGNSNVMHGHPLYSPPSNPTTRARRADLDQDDSADKNVSMPSFGSRLDYRSDCSDAHVVREQDDGDEKKIIRADGADSNHHDEDSFADDAVVRELRAMINEYRRALGPP